MDNIVLALIIIFGIIILGVIITLIWWVSVLNELRRCIVKIDEAESGIDVALTKRYDLLTKSLATVKGYAKHEYETLSNITKMRNPSVGSSMEEKSNFANEIGKGIEKVSVIMENYPDLKASVNFQEFQDQISEVEDHLQAARRLYNSNVSYLNQNIVVWPKSIIARRNSITKRDFFEAEEIKRKDVVVEF